MAKNLRLAEELLHPPTHGNVKSSCTVQEAIDSLDPEDRAVVVAAVDNPKWNSSALAAALKRNGVDVHATSLTRHRGGRCICHRQAAKDTE